MTAIVLMVIVERASSSRDGWNVDLPDCLSFALMEAEGIQRAFSYLAASLSLDRLLSGSCRWQEANPRPH